MEVHISEVYSFFLQVNRPGFRIFHILQDPWRVFTYTEIRIHIHIYHKSKCTRIFNKEELLLYHLKIEKDSPPCFCVHCTPIPRFVLFSKDFISLVFTCFFIAFLCLTYPFNWSEGSYRTILNNYFIYRKLWGSSCFIFLLYYLHFLL